MESPISQWLNRDPDPSTRQELQQLINTENKQELAERFSSRLAFGTAGLRGKVGAGPNRMNRLVVQETSLGLGHYLEKTIPNAKQKGVFIGYDARPDSKQFAHDSAEVLLSLGFNVYLTDNVVPTPFVAFGVRHFSTAAGIVVTASHNPPEYNGYKVYWENGAQIIPPHDHGIAACIDEATKLPITLTSLSNADGKLHWLGESFYQTYLDKMLKSSELITTTPKQASIAYTAMHGVGGRFISTIASTTGFERFYTVKEQYDPDGMFPTVNFPNPEEPGAMDKVIALAKEKNADIACANDPDADRFAAAAKTESGHYRMLTGDQVGILLADYILSNRQQPCWIGNTIVSSSLLENIASKYGASYFKTLTGFKWLTNVAMENQTETKPFVFAYEEALGYTVNNLVWDKDGLSAFAVFTSLAETLKQQQKSVWDRLSEIYQQYGFYVTAQKSIAFDPNEQSIGEKLRLTPPTRIAGKQILCTEDFLSSVKTLSSGETKPLDFPESDVLIYHLEDGYRVIVRPSGTEPKIKCYYELSYPMAPGEGYWKAQEHADEHMTSFIKQHQAELGQ
ncbi:phospho-sugar mutase [Vibrio salinus]|uniref:phospho-sugar mutase n=1 Tax=Vibrio salinus TaxID=2899784 RepID=UPI001E6036B5|nr:phospho-sugar mutase [Vibrio salinus]MCE0494944.1 phospho-sugar mutase [Vibrio salinus]